MELCAVAHHSDFIHQVPAVLDRSQRAGGSVGGVLELAGVDEPSLAERGRGFVGQVVKDGEPDSMDNG